MHPMLTVLLQGAVETATQGGAPATSPAGSPTAPPGMDLSFLILPVMLFGIFYLLVFRPQRKEQKRRAEMLSQIKKGDRVLTHAGIIGTVAILKEDTISLQVDENVRIQFSRGAIAQVMNAEEREKVAVGK